MWRRLLLLPRIWWWILCCWISVEVVWSVVIHRDSSLFLFPSLSTLQPAIHSRMLLSSGCFSCSFSLSYTSSSYGPWSRKITPCSPFLFFWVRNTFSREKEKERKKQIHWRAKIFDGQEPSTAKIRPEQRDTLVWYRQILHGWLFSTVFFQAKEYREGNIFSLELLFAGRKKKWNRMEARNRRKEFSMSSSLGTSPRYAPRRWGDCPAT